MRTVRTALLTVATTTLLLLACKDEAPSQPIAKNDGEHSGPQSTPSADRFELEGLKSDIGTGRRNAVFADPATSDEVKAVLADGVITFSEYERSVLAMADCVRNSGGVFYRPDQPKLSWRGLYTYSTGFPESVPGAQAAITGCLDRHVGMLDLFWKELTDPTEQEEREAMDDLAGCMAAMGLSDVIPENRTRDDFDMLGPKLSEDRRGLYMSCAQKIAETHALPYFGPSY